MDFLKNNFEWLFGGIGVALFSFILTLFKAKSKATAVNNLPPSNNNITINNSVNAQGVTEITDHKTADDRLKDRTRILFVDDMHTEYKMVSILKRAGWVNTKSLKDILDLDDPKVQEADIIFVDINGVGKTMFEDQGLGLASALKTKYKTKKIILYSAETAGDRFHKALREVDDCLAKNAEPYQFINLVEGLSKDL